MLDIRLLREDPELVKTRVKTRGGDAYALVDEILSCDETRRAAETDKQQLQGDRKRISKQIGQLKGKGEDTSAVEDEVREIGEKIKALDETSKAADERQRELLLQVPNIPHEACPVGEDETSNPVVREWGEKPAFDFEPKDHLTLCTESGMLDFETATKVSTGGFALFRGAGPDWSVP